MTITISGGVVFTGGATLTETALSLNFTKMTSLDSRITFSRATVATLVNSSGDITVVDSGVPRFTYDALTLESQGLLVESASKNVVLQSANFGSTPWSTSNVTVSTKVSSPDGATNADTLIATVNNGYMAQNISDTGNGDKVVSVFLKQGTATETKVVLRDSSLGFSRLDSVITWISGNPSVSIVEGAYQGIEAFKNGWFRISFLASSVVASSTNSLRVHPSGVSATGSVCCWGVQSEDRTTSTSYIPTTSVSVTRASDVAVMSGTSFSSWYNPLAGAFSVSGRNAAVGSCPLISVDDTTSSNKISFLTDGINIDYAITTAGTPQLTLNPGFALSGRMFTVAGSYYLNDFSSAANGGTIIQDLSGTLPNVTQMRIGSDSAGNYLNGTIAIIYYYNFNKSVSSISGAKDSRNYGVRWDLTSSSSSAERLGGAIGLNAVTAVGTSLPAGSNSFDSIYPWSNMRRCAIKKLPNNSTQIIYEGEPGYATDGSAGDVMVEVPLFYYDRYIDGNYEYRFISGVGSDPHPAFVENGVVLDYVYVSAFEGTISSSIMYSKSGALPTSNTIPQTLLSTATAKGTGWSMMDSRIVDMLENLLWIEYATRNSTNVIGHGISDMVQARTDYVPISYAATNTNNLVTASVLSSNDQERFWPGADMLICDTLQTNIIARRKVVSVTVNSPSAGNSTVTIDGDPLNVTTTMFFGGAPQETGQTDAMAYHTGRLDRPKAVPASTIQRNRLNCNQYRGIENPCGNMWHYLPDVTFSGGIMYKSNNITDYQFGKTTGSYTYTTSNVPVQPGNTQGVDALWLTSMISGSGLNEGIPYAASSIIDGSESTYFGAAHYLATGLNAVVHGGGFDHKDRTNIATMRAWPDVATGASNLQWYLYGGRLMWKNI